MVWIERRITRTSQPQELVGIDWSNPLTVGLELAYLPGHLTDSSGKIPGVLTLGTATERFGASITQPGTNRDNGLVVKSGQLLGPLQESTIIGIASTTAGYFGGASGSETDGFLGSGGNAIYSERGSSGNDIYKVGAVAINPNEGTEFTYRNDAGTLLQQRIFGTVLDGKPHFYGAVKNGTSHTAYLEKISTTGTFGSGSSAFTDATNQIRIGADRGGIESSWNGQIDLVAGWSRALSDSEIKDLVDNPWQIFEPIVEHVWFTFTPAPTFVQPVGTVSTGSWTPTGAATLYGAINEVTPSDAEYISVTGANTCEMILEQAQYPGTANQVLSYYASSTNGSMITITLKQGTTTIMSRTHALTATNTLYNQTLTAPEIASIVAGPINVTLATS